MPSVRALTWFVYFILSLCPFFLHCAVEIREKLSELLVAGRRKLKICHDKYFRFKDIRLERMMLKRNERPQTLHSMLYSYGICFTGNGKFFIKEKVL